MSSSRETYIGSIDSRWRSELRNARQRAMVFSPYLTSPMARLVVECVSPEICQIYTRLRLEDFALGASSLRTLRELKDRGYSIYELNSLHAKMIIVDESFASIGSQNLTEKGASNLEASVALVNPAEIAGIVERIQSWLGSRRPVTTQKLKYLEEVVAEVKKRYEAARREITPLERRVRQALQRMDRESWAERVRVGVNQVVRDGLGSKNTAHKFIREAAWWVQPRAEIGEVPAASKPGSLRGSEGDWYLRMPGGSAFFVSRAIHRCVATIEAFMADVAVGKAWAREKLLEGLRLNVRSSAGKPNGEESKHPYRMDEEHRMNFGNHHIKVDFFIRIFGLPLDDIPGANSTRLKEVPA